MKKANKKNILLAGILTVTAGNVLARSIDMNAGINQRGTIILPNNQLENSMIKGSLTIKKCHAYPDFYLNGKKHPRKQTVYSSQGSTGSSYVLFVKKKGQYRVEARMPPGACSGSWTPRSLNVSITRDKQQVTHKNFTFNGRAMVTKIPLFNVIAALQIHLSSMRIHLNNYGSRHGNSWQMDNDSYTQIGTGSKMKKKIFTIPEVNSDPYRYYTNDINLNGYPFRSACLL